MKSASRTPGRASRRTLRGWMTVTDLVAAVCGTWVAVGTWHSSHSAGTTVLRFLIAYGAVHALARWTK